MLSKIWSAAIVGLDAVPVEVDIASQEDVDELVGHYNALKRYWEMVGGMKRYQKLANKAGEGTLRKDILNNLPSDHALIDAISNLAIYEPIVRSKIAAIHTTEHPSLTTSAASQHIELTSLSQVQPGRFDDLPSIRETNGINWNQDN